MADVEVEYSITAVEVIDDMVILSLRRTQETKSPMMVPLKPHISEEEQVAQRMAQATMQVVKEEFAKMPSPFERPKLPLSWEEYEKLGKPTINDLLIVTLTYVKRSETLMSEEFSEEELMWIYNALCDYDKHHFKYLKEESVQSLRRLIRKIENDKRKKKEAKP